MDFTLPIVYNSLTVNALTRAPGGKPSSGYLIDKFDPSQIEVRQFLDGKGQADGIDASDVFLGRRWASLIVTVYGSTAGDFWDKQDAFLAAFSPTIAYAADSANLGFLPLTFYQPTANIASWPVSAYPNGMPLQYYLRAMEPVRYTYGRDFIGGASGNGKALTYHVTLIARDPRKYAQTATTATITTSLTSTTNRGNYVTEPTFSIVTTSTTGLMDITIQGVAVTIVLDATSTTYTLDSVLKTYYKAGVARPDLVNTTNATYPTLSAGSNNMIRTAVTGATATMTYRDAFA